MGYTRKSVIFVISDREGTDLVAGDYVETKLVKGSLFKRGIQNYNFKRPIKYGVVEKVCPKTVKVNYFNGSKTNYMFSDEVRKMSREEATFHTLRIAEKI